MKKNIFLVLILALTMFLPACFGTKSLKGQKIKSFEVKLQNEPKFCPNNPFNMDITIKLADGDIIKTSDMTGGVAWSDIVVDVKGGVFSPQFTKGIITPNEKLSITEDSYLDLNVYSKYHPNQAFKRKIKLGYDCNYKLNYKGRDGSDGYSGERGGEGQKGETVEVRVQLVKMEGTPILQVLVTNAGQSKKLFLSTKDGKLSIDASGGNGGNGGNGRSGEMDKKGIYYRTNGQRGGRGGAGGIGGDVTFIFSPQSIAYKSLFKANVSRGDGGYGGRGGDGKKGSKSGKAKDGKDGNSFFVSHVEERDGKKVNVISTGSGKTQYLTEDLPENLW
jgi:hypothetical protein